MDRYIPEFEKLIADYYGAPYAIAVDCCTHAIELCLRLSKPYQVSCPRYTYISVPMTFEKLSIPWVFDDHYWKNTYRIGNTNIIDAAVFWQENGYVPGTLMCLSFQYKKHLNLGRGGMILSDDLESVEKLRKMRYDGRVSDIPWMDQDIDTIGYHYYMTPETAQQGIDKFYEVVTKIPKTWYWRDYPDLTKMKVFHAKFQ